MCFNKGGYSVDVPMRRFVLISEEKMLLRDLERIRTKLAKLAKVGSKDKDPMLIE
jgi:hypothetical protein